MSKRTIILPHEGILWGRLNRTVVHVACSREKRRGLEEVSHSYFFAVVARLVWGRWYHCLVLGPNLIHATHRLTVRLTPDMTSWRESRSFRFASIALALGGHSFTSG